MDQFKKSLYRPVLKTVRPGEQKKDTPRFDFSKKFAELIKKEADSSPGLDSDSTATEANPPLEFKPANAPKLNLQREGLLNMKYDEPKPSVEAAVPTSSVLDLSSSSDTSDMDSIQTTRPDTSGITSSFHVTQSDTSGTTLGFQPTRPDTNDMDSIQTTQPDASGITSGFQLTRPDTGDITSGFRTAQPPSHNNQPASHAPSLTLHNILDEAMYNCQSKLIGLESQLSILEGEMPVAISHLDEQIGSI
jgi:hypothetical protein